jgi:hypothetical protein
VLAERQVELKRQPRQRTTASRRGGTLLAAAHFDRA